MTRASSSPIRTTWMRRFRERRMVTPADLSGPLSSRPSFKSTPPIQLQFLTWVAPNTGLSSGSE